jgi:uncharacterized Ntn-hydrolase superfamily protein
MAQVAVVDGSGRVAGFTGRDCEPEAGITFGTTCCGAANLMERPGVPEAMVEAFESAIDRTFAERLVLALAAGDALGGDIRGRQSAAVAVVVPPGSARAAGVDLRVDDSRVPLLELTRLLTLHSADALVASSVDTDGHYREVEVLQTAVALAPDDLGCVSALSLALLRAARLDEALPHLTHLMSLEPRTPARVKRLIETGHLDEQVGHAALKRLRLD